MIGDEVDVLGYVRAAELQRTKAGARIGMDAAANLDRYGTERMKEIIERAQGQQKQ